jgi:hypothetical protein
MKDALRRGVAEDATEATALKFRSSTREAMDVGALARLHQQIQQVLGGLRIAEQPNKKS